MDLFMREFIGMLSRTSNNSMIKAERGKEVPPEEILESSKIVI